MISFHVHKAMGKTNYGFNAIKLRRRLDGKNYSGNYFCLFPDFKRELIPLDVFLYEWMLHVLVFLVIQDIGETDHASEKIGL